MKIILKKLGKQIGEISANASNQSLLEFYHFHAAIKQEKNHLTSSRKRDNIHV